MTATYRSLLGGTTSPGIYHWVGGNSRDLGAEAADAGREVLLLDTSAITDRAAFYEEIVTAWGLPSWFGNNLDALFDVLGDITAGPTVLIWEELGHLAAAEPEFVASVLDVLRDAIEQAERFSVILRGDTGLSTYDALL